MRTGLDRAGASEGPVEISVETAPSASSPASPVTFRVARTLTGPEATITTVTENRYRNEWTPLLVPMGLLVTPTAPLAFLGGILSGEPDKAWTLIFDGGPDPCKHAMFGTGLRWMVGISPGCGVAESRTAEEKAPTGKTVAESVPLAGVDARGILTARGEAPREGAGKTGPDGRFAFAVATAFREFREEPRDAAVTLRVGSGEERTVPLDPEAVRLLYLPVAEERAGDRALSEGRSLPALDHFSRAMVADPSGGVALRDKVRSVYRSLPVKPPLPEEARRLFVQGEALAKNDDADGAIAKLSAGLRIAPWYPSAHHDLALVQAMKGDYASAIASMNAFVELTPDAAAARQGRDRIYAWEALAPAAPAGAGPGQGFVGLELGGRDGKVVVMGVVPGSAAATSGIRPGDELLQVNGVSTEGMEPSAAAERVRGKSGEVVSLGLVRPSDGTRIDVKITRSPVRGAAPAAERRGR